MPIAYFFEFADYTQTMAEQLTERILPRIGSGIPAGAIYHAEGPLDDSGWWAVDVWETEERAEPFYREVFIPALESMDVAPPQPRKLSVLWEATSQSEHL